MRRSILSIGVHILIITAMVGMCCTPKLFDNTRNNSNRAKQTIRGQDNTATSQGAQSSNQGVGDVVTAPGSAVLVLQTGEAGVLGLIVVGGFAAWFVVRRKHGTEYKTARRLLHAIEDEHIRHKISGVSSNNAQTIKYIKLLIASDGKLPRHAGYDRVEHNIRCHLEKMGYRKKGTA